jgi:hypothetical protein
MDQLYDLISGQIPLDNRCVINKQLFNEPYESRIKCINSRMFYVLFVIKMNVLWQSSVLKLN